MWGKVIYGTESTKIGDFTSLKLEHSIFKQKVGVDSEASSDGFFFLGWFSLPEGKKKVPEVWICILFIDDIYTFTLKCLEFGRRRNCNKKMYKSESYKENS